MNNDYVAPNFTPEQWSNRLAVYSIWLGEPVELNISLLGDQGVKRFYSAFLAGNRGSGTTALEAMCRCASNVEMLEGITVEGIINALDQVGKDDSLRLLGRDYEMYEWVRAYFSDELDLKALGIE